MQFHELVCSSFLFLSSSHEFCSACFHFYIFFSADLGLTPLKPGLWLQFETFFSSFLDIISDIILYGTYLNTEHVSLTKTVSYPKDPSVLNVTGFRRCENETKTEYGLYEFSCVEETHYFAFITILCIYLPSLNVMATLFGPRTAGRLGITWGVLLLIVVNFTPEFHSKIFFYSIFIAMVPLGCYLGCTRMRMGCTRKMKPQGQGKIKMTMNQIIKSYVSQFLLFPMLLPFSPMIFLTIKLLGKV